MKESEATQKWCPFARLIIAMPHKTLVGATEFMSIPAHNRVQKGPEHHTVTPCVGSNCAAWIRDQPPAEDGIAVINIEPYGHCGLAR